MSENILEKIIEKKKNRLIDLKKKRPLESLLEHPSDSMAYYNFKQAIEQNNSENKISIIAESKKQVLQQELLLKIMIRYKLQKFIKIIKLHAYQF